MLELYYYMSNGLTFEILNIMLRNLRFDQKKAFAKLEGNRFRIDGEIGENRAIPFNYDFG